MKCYLLEAAPVSSRSGSIVSGHSRAARWSVGQVTAIGLTASVLASMTSWLLVTDPVTVSIAVSTGDAEGLLRVVGTALVDILRTLVRYL